MREIKFRALCEGKWVNVPVGYKRLNIDRDTLSQFTGLQDKNGVDIYEGDIVQPLYNRFEPVSVIFTRGAYNITKYDISNCEVIGNIHENPELLAKGGAE